MSDLISRQAAIEALKHLRYKRPLDSDRYVITDCEDAILALPSAQPEKTLLTVKCEFDDEELRRAIEAAKNAELELIAAQPEECEYWDNESHYCALNRDHPHSRKIIRCGDGRGQ